jgi:tetratricopeptide (TPR) repeat protein
MAEKKHVPESASDQAVVDRAKDFWTKYNRQITIIATIIILAGGGWLIYKYYFKEPNEQKAADAIFKAEEYYRMDSLQKALNGDGFNPGFLRVISKYGGTEAGNLAHFYAGDIYLKMGDYAKAVKHLKDFKSSAKQIQARAYKLLGDAYAELGKNQDALDYYKKAAHHYEDDQENSSEYLFMAAYFADRVMKKTKEATELFKELKEKYPRTEKGVNADKYLAQLGVYN